jgi:zinc/manganese transport system substrate-binding protein
MRKCLLLAVLLCSYGLVGDGHAELKVVATLSDLGWIAEEVGGEDVEVSVLCPGHQDPHYLPAKPSLGKRLREADLLVYNGLELEIGWLPVLLQAAGNPHIKPGSRGELECAAAVKEVLEVPTGNVDRSRGDIHPLGNPHFLLDPRNGVAVGRLMAERMAELDPDHAEAYMRRAEDLTAIMEQRIHSWKEMLGDLSASRVIVYHQHWEYLLEWLGLQQIGAIEHRPGISPSPRHVEELIKRGRSTAGVFIVAAPWDNLKISEEAANRMGRPLVILPGAVEGVKEATGYPELFDYICKQLAEALAAGLNN